MEELLNARKDYLTDFYTRESLFPMLEKMTVEASKHGAHFSLIILDLDHFKAFNDRYGHLHGDSALKHVSAVINRSLANVDNAIFRFGGDEFVILFPNKTAKDTMKLADTLQKAIMIDRFLLFGQSFKFSFSAGLASSATDGRTVEELLTNADKAMYVSKKRGRGRTVQYSKMYIHEIKNAATKTIIFFVTIALAAYSVYFFRNDILEALTNIKSVQIIMLKGNKSDVVYLKKGGVVKGVITRESKDEVELQLVLDEGNGSVIIKRANIRDIKRFQ